MISLRSLLFIIFIVAFINSCHECDGIETDANEFNDFLVNRLNHLKLLAANRRLAGTEAPRGSFQDIEVGSELGTDIFVSAYSAIAVSNDECETPPYPSFWDEDSPMSVSVNSIQSRFISEYLEYIVSLNVDNYDDPTTSSTYILSMLEGISSHDDEDTFDITSSLYFSGNFQILGIKPRLCPAVSVCAKLSYQSKFQAQTSIPPVTIVSSFDDSYDQILDFTGDFSSTSVPCSSGKVRRRLSEMIPNKRRRVQSDVTQSSVDADTSSMSMTHIGKVYSVPDHGFSVHLESQMNRQELLESTMRTPSLGRLPPIRTPEDEERANIAARAVLRKVRSLADPPANFDWRLQAPQCNKSAEPKDQGSCGSCYAFSTAITYSWRLCIKSSAKFNIFASPQEMMNCKADGTAGCEGGNEDTHFRQMVDTTNTYANPAMQNIVSTYCAPYTAKDSSAGAKCGTRCNDMPVFTGKDFIAISQKAIINNGGTAADFFKATKMEIMNNGPLTMSGIVPKGLFGLSATKIFDTDGTPAAGGHAMTIIGWGKDATSGVEYYLIQNSWGASFGDLGVGKVAMGKNVFNMEDDPSFPAQYTGITPTWSNTCTTICLNNGEIKNDCTCKCDPTKTFFGDRCDQCALKIGTDALDCIAEGTDSVDFSKCSCRCKPGYTRSTCNHKIVPQKCDSGVCSDINVLVSLPTATPGDIILIVPFPTTAVTTDMINSAPESNKSVVCDVADNWTSYTAYCAESLSTKTWTTSASGLVKNTPYVFAYVPFGGVNEFKNVRGWGFQDPRAFISSQPFVFDGSQVLIQGLQCSSVPCFSKGSQTGATRSSSTCLCPCITPFFGSDCSSYVAVLACTNCNKKITVRYKIADGFEYNRLTVAPALYRGLSPVDVAIKVQALLSAGSPTVVQSSFLGSGTAAKSTADVMVIDVSSLSSGSYDVYIERSSDKRQFLIALNGFQVTGASFTIVDASVSVPSASYTDASYWNTLEGGSPTAPLDCNGSPVVDNMCRCAAGKYGVKCEKSCTCQNSSTCNADGSCNCTPAFYGTSCEKPSPCVNGGIVNAVGVCWCPAGFSGATCSVKNRCLNGGSLDSSDKCVCTSGFAGAECAIRCPTCQHGGTCNATTGACTCPSGFYGTLCQITCNSFTCTSGKGVCTADGSCECSSGYFGSNCSSSCTCNNNAKCFPLTGKCDCPSGTVGSDCSSAPTASPTSAPSPTTSPSAPNLCPDSKFGVNCKSSATPLQCETSCSNATRVFVQVAESGDNLRYFDSVLLVPSSLPLKGASSPNFVASKSLCAPVVGGSSDYCALIDGSVVVDIPNANVAKGIYDLYIGRYNKSDFSINYTQSVKVYSNIFIQSSLTVIGACKNPCLNGGKIIPNTACSCSCLPGFHGDNCEAFVIPVSDQALGATVFQFNLVSNKYPLWVPKAFDVWIVMPQDGVLTSSSVSQAMATGRICPDAATGSASCLSGSFTVSHKALNSQVSYRIYILNSLNGGLNITVTDALRVDQVFNIGTGQYGATSTVVANSTSFNTAAGSAALNKGNSLILGPQAVAGSTETFTSAINVVLSTDSVYTQVRVLDAVAVTKAHAAFCASIILTLTTIAGVDKSDSRIKCAVNSVGKGSTVINTSLILVGSKSFINSAMATPTYKSTLQKNLQRHTDLASQFAQSDLEVNSVAGVTATKTSGAMSMHRNMFSVLIVCFTLAVYISM